MLGTSLNAVGITTATVAHFAIRAQLNFSFFKNHIRFVSENAITQSQDVYVEKNESNVAGTTILSMVTLTVVIAMLAKGYPTLAT